MGLKLKQNENDVGWFVISKLVVVDVMGYTFENDEKIWVEF